MAGSCIVRFGTVSSSAVVGLEHVCLSSLIREFREYLPLSPLIECTVESELGNRFACCGINVKGYHTIYCDPRCI